MPKPQNDPQRVKGGAMSRHPLDFFEVPSPAAPPPRSCANCAPMEADEDGRAGYCLYRGCGNANYPPEHRQRITDLTGHCGQHRFKTKTETKTTKAERRKGAK